MSVRVNGSMALFVAAVVLIVRSVCYAAPGPHPERAAEAARLNDEAIRLAYAGRHAEAVGVAERAEEASIDSLGPNDPRLSRVFANLAQVYAMAGEFSAAEARLDRAMRLFEAAIPAGDPQLAMVLNGVAILYQQIGAYTKSLALLQRALDNVERSTGPNSREFAAVLDNTAGARLDQGDFATAEAMYLRSIQIREHLTPPDPNGLGTSLLNAGLLYHAMRDLERAHAMYDRAVPLLEKALGPDTAEFASVLTNLAALTMDRGDAAGAEELYRRALSIQQQTLDPENGAITNTLNALGELYDAKGDFAQAEPLLRRALELREKRFGPESPAVATSLNNLAMLECAQGHLAEAEPMLVRALAIRRAFSANHPALADAMSTLAEFYTWRGDDERAVSLLEETSEARERAALDALTVGSEAQRRAFLAASSGELVGAVVLALRSGSDHAARVAMTEVLRRKSRALDAMSDTIKAARRRMKGASARKFEDLMRVRSQLAHLTSSRDARPSAPERAQQLAAREQELERSFVARDVGDPSVLQPITLAAVQAQIPEDAVLVEWTYYLPLPLPSARTRSTTGARIAAAILRHHGAPEWLDFGDAAALAGELQAAREAMTDRAVDSRPAARQLDAKLFAPVRARLGAIRSVMIAPDGLLALIPFGALIDEHGRYLLEDWRISYLASGRELLQLEDRVPSRSSPLVMGNPEYGPIDAHAASTPTESELSTMRFLPIPETELEARAVADTLPSARVFTRSEATEQALKAEHGPAILHIATHGFFFPKASPPADTQGVASVLQNPLLRAGLVFAGANARRSGNDDGILTGLELGSLDLDGTKLVVLSACETGMGDPTVGEGLDGLRRALRLAGAESQILTLWNVDDEATRVLMTTMYRRLHAGESRAEALREAQLAMLHDPTHAHPSYWAAFTLSGNPGRIATVRAAEPPQLAPTNRGCACRIGAPQNSGTRPARGLIAILGFAFAVRLRAWRRRRTKLLLAGLVALCALNGCRSAPEPAPSRPFPGGLWVHGGGAARGGAEPLRQLEWPPPRPTDMCDLGEVSGALGTALLRIRELLRPAQLSVHVYAIRDNGFAVVTRLESITDTGKPRADPGRFSFDDAGRIFSEHFLEVLFNLHPGRYRFFTFAVTPTAIVPKDKQRSWSAAREIYSAGSEHLPPELANLSAPVGTHLSILLYEYVRPEPDDEAPNIVTNSALSLREHMLRAGLRADGVCDP